MKKKLVLLTIAVLLLAIATVAFAACDPEEELTGLALIQQQYNDIISAKTIGQSITIKSGDITQFESEKTYTKTEGGYTVTGTEKKFNGVDKLFDETPINETVQKAADAKPTLKLNEQYFEAGFRLSDTGLTANVKQGNIKDVFGVTGELKAPTDNLMLELNVSGGHVATVRINYDSEGSHVTITLTMTY